MIKLKMVFVLFILLAILTLGCSEQVQTSGEKEETTPERVLRDYLETVILEKDPEKAYKMLDPNHLPVRERFNSDVLDHDVTDYKIVESKELDENTYQFLVQFTRVGEDNEAKVFVVKIDDQWLVSVRLGEDNPNN